MDMVAMLVCDFYKIGHPFQYTPGTRLVYSNLTPRKSRRPEMDKLVVFGLQQFMKKYLVEYFNKNFFELPFDEVMTKYKRRIETSIGPLSSYKHIEDLHKLGYLPLVIKALPEGTKINMRVPCLLIYNTIDEFFWLTNFIETLLSCSVWGPSTSATIAAKYREVLDKFAEETGMPKEFTQWQGHDFSFRGMNMFEAAYSSGMGHLLSFTGTDTIPAIDALEQYYNADCEKELIGGSIPATEHSVMSSSIVYLENEMKKGLYQELIDEYNSIFLDKNPDNYRNIAEYVLFKRLITEVYPSGLTSIVSDTFDLFAVLTKYLPRLKDVIMNRNGRLVIRPDSGDPVLIMCGSARVIDLDLPEEATLAALEAEALEYLEDQVRESTPHGRYGKIKESGYFKFNDSEKIYKIAIDINWNRYDKQYYFIEESDITSCVEATLSPTEKGVIQLLWETFGGTITDKGYKLLDTHVGAIYGDSITIERAELICQILKEKGFASQCVFGIGSYTYQYNTRDTFGTAMKATYTEVDEYCIDIFKDPITDSGEKKSAKGLLSVVIEDGEYVLKEGITWEQSENETELVEVFRDGKITKEYSLSEIRKRLHPNWEI